MLAISIGKEINVEADGMFCSVLMLFAMLIAIICIIALSNWKMTKIFGIFNVLFILRVLSFCFMHGLRGCYVHLRQEVKIPLTVAHINQVDEVR